VGSRHRLVHRHAARDDDVHHPSDEEPFLDRFEFPYE
jgi:hypothetical protein